MSTLCFSNWCNIVFQPNERLFRRNSLTTLHSLPVSAEDEELRSIKKLGLERQATVPHGFNVSHKPGHGYLKFITNVISYLQFRCKVIIWTQCDCFKIGLINYGWKPACEASTHCFEILSAVNHWMKWEAKFESVLV